MIRSTTFLQCLRSSSRVGRKITPVANCPARLSTSCSTGWAQTSASAETSCSCGPCARFTHFGTTTQFLRREGRFFVRTDGPDGRPGEFEVAYTFGIDPLQQYLLHLDGGRLQALSIAWDARPAAQGGQRWFHLYPDEAIPHGDALHWTGINQNWNHMCADCHSTGVRKGYQVEEDRYETTWREIDVACEACHGPGAAHVRWAEDAKTDSAREDAGAEKGLALNFAGRGEWIFDAGAAIARRSSEPMRRVEVETCGRCHARRALLREQDVSGGPLMDTHRPALLDESLSDQKCSVRDRNAGRWTTPCQRTATPG